MSQLSHSSWREVTDLELEVEGIIFHKHKELETTINEEGNEESVLSLTRAIGDRVYTVQQRVIDGVVTEETCETQMSPEEIEDFKNEWDEKWPSGNDEESEISSSDDDEDEDDDLSPTTSWGDSLYEPSSNENYEDSSSSDDSI